MTIREKRELWDLTNMGFQNKVPEPIDIEVEDAQSVVK